MVHENNTTRISPQFHRRQLVKSKYNITNKKPRFDLLADRASTLKPSKLRSKEALARTKRPGSYCQILSRANNLTLDWLEISSIPSYEGTSPFLSSSSVYTGTGGKGER